jgi:hypothetical protein
MRVGAMSRDLGVPVFSNRSTQEYSAKNPPGRSTKQDYKYYVANPCRRRSPKYAKVLNDY